MHYLGLRISNLKQINDTEYVRRCKVKKNSSKYNQTCIKRSPVGQIKCGLLRQVTSWKRVNSYEVFYDKTRKGDILIQVTA